MLCKFNENIESLMFTIVVRFVGVDFEDGAHTAMVNYIGDYISMNAIQASLIGFLSLLWLGFSL